MWMRCRVSTCIIFLFSLLLFAACANNSGNSDIGVESPKTTNNESIYSNPIDAYYLPLIENAGTQAERSMHQDNYGGAWQSEYENILTWMKNKCTHQVDIDNLNMYDATVSALIDTSRIVLITDWLDDYNLPQGNPDRYSWGNGTRSGLNQAQGEIYRDAGMRLIGGYDHYVFLERDYASLYYEGIQPWDKPYVSPSSEEFENANP